MSTERTLLALAAVIVGGAILSRKAGAAEIGDDIIKEITVTARRLGEGGSVDRVFTGIVETFVPRGIRNNNPMNVRKTAIDWKGEVIGTDTEYETFADPCDGIRAGSRVLLNYKRRHGLRTVNGIISRYAPTTENPTAAYIAAVSKALQVGAQDIIDVEDPNTLARLATAIIRHENGQQPYTAEMIRRCSRAAF